MTKYIVRVMSQKNPQVLSDPDAEPWLATASTKVPSQVGAVLACLPTHMTRNNLTSVAATATGSSQKKAVANATLELRQNIKYAEKVVKSTKIEQVEIRT